MKLIKGKENYMIELRYNSQVDFFEYEHLYMSIFGDTLTGLTSILGATIFKDKYKDIPLYILNKAAAYGSSIHSKCQENDLFGCSDCEEVDNYIKIKEDNNLVPVESEYLVSDNSRVATLIDVIFEATENSVHLADIKTTSKLDTNYLSWQLSICAYLFNIQNPDINVDKLYGIWLRKDKYKLIEVERKKNSEIEELLNNYFDSIK